LFPLRLPQAASPAAKARRLAEVKAYFSQFFMIKTPFFIFKFKTILVIYFSQEKLDRVEKTCFSVSLIL